MTVRVGAGASDRGLPVSRLLSDAEWEKIKPLVSGGMTIRDAVSSLNDPDAPQEGNPRHCALCRARAVAREATT